MTSRPSETIRDFRDRTQAVVNSTGLTADATQSLVEETRRLHPGWALEMLIPINAGAVAK